MEIGERITDVIAQTYPELYRAIGKPVIRSVEIADHGNAGVVCIDYEAPLDFCHSYNPSSPVDNKNAPTVQGGLLGGILDNAMTMAVTMAMAMAMVVAMAIVAKKASASLAPLSCLYANWFSPVQSEELKKCGTLSAEVSLWPCSVGKSSVLLCNSLDYKPTASCKWE